MTTTRRKNAFLHICRWEIHTPLTMEEVRAALAHVVTPRMPGIAAQLMGARSEKEYCGDISKDAFTLAWEWKERNPNGASPYETRLDIQLVPEEQGTGVFIRVRHTDTARTLFRILEFATVIPCITGLVLFIRGEGIGIFVVFLIIFAMVYLRDVTTSSADFEAATDNLLLALKDEEAAHGVAG